MVLFLLWGWAVTDNNGSRKKAIRLKCLDCCCGNPVEVRLCTAKNCPLWRFRLGKESKEETNENVGCFLREAADESQPIPREEIP